MTTDKDLAEMFRASQNVDVLHLSDNEILQGFKDANSKIVREYFYGYCRIAYCIYDKRYGLRTKPGMDFFTLAHEYYLYLIEHDFKPLEDRKSSMSLKTWMVNGFRYLLLDRLKGVEKEHLFDSFEARQEKPSSHIDVANDEFKHEFISTINEIYHKYYGRDNMNSIILRMLFIEGFKSKEVAEQMGMTPSAITQRYNRMMHDVVIPYFKRYFVASEYESSVYATMETKSCMPCMAKMSIDADFAEPSEYNNMDNMKQGRITPEWIDTLKDNEVFVFGSNLAGMHGGGAARVAHLRFGAVLGKGVGLQGQSYAIPTMQGGVETIRPYVNDFIAFAKANPDKHFLVTPIGCGIAGFEPEDIAPLFESAKTINNISLPESFWEVIE